ncbi:MAG TPA: DUF3306 domain-containing protein [Casimicrobiaceae bacterium]|nr:DUF3306 domain-containing protein [Casimicrobiaceae bacterium]
MSEDSRDRLTLSRWSRRKLEAARAKGQPPPVSPPPAAAAPAAPVAPTPAPTAEAEALPPVESLTIDSDFSAFLSPKVDEAVKRAALRKLFSDPRFNVMDGLDIYIDDYTKADPLPEDVIAKLADVYKTLTEEIPADPAPSQDSACAAEADPAAAPETAKPDDVIPDTQA